MVPVIPVCNSLEYLLNMRKNVGIKYFFIKFFFFEVNNSSSESLSGEIDRLANEE